MKRDHYTQIIEEIDQMVADAGIDPAAAIDHPLDEVEAFLMRFVAYPSDAARVRDPQRAQQLRGDLDTLILKAIHPEAERRYASAAALAEDIDRFLSGRPIRARPDSRSYRLRKFVRRHRLGVIAASIGLAGLLAHSMLPGGSGWSTSLGGMAAGLAVFFPFFALGGLGGGDVKLMAALGAWIGWPAVLSLALYTALAGGVVAICVALAHGYLRQALRNLVALARFWKVAGVRPAPELTLEHGRGPRVPYALPIFVGLLVTVWLG